MIKGVNHQIIEVRETGNPYFERALLFVSNKCTDIKDEELTDKAGEYVRRAKAYSGMKEARALRRLKCCALILLGGCGGTILGLILSTYA